MFTLLLIHWPQHANVRFKTKWEWFVSKTSSKTRSWSKTFIWILASWGARSVARPGCRGGALCWARRGWGRAGTAVRSGGASHRTAPAASTGLAHFLNIRAQKHSADNYYIHISSHFKQNGAILSIVNILDRIMTSFSSVYSFDYCRKYSFDTFTSSLSSTKSCVAEGEREWRMLFFNNYVLIISIYR